MPSGDITKILQAVGRGDKDAFEDLFPLVYRELKQLARYQVGGAADRTLNATALVNEAYLKLIDQSQPRWSDRKHFLRVSAMAMRQIAVDHARQHQAKKRGGDQHITVLEESRIPVEDGAVELVALNEAMDKLEQRNGRLVRVVELRYFAGLTVEETATVLEVDPATVKRDWRKARAFLYHELGGSTADPTDG